VKLAISALWMKEMQELCDRDVQLRTCWLAPNLCYCNALLQSVLLSFLPLEDSNINPNFGQCVGSIHLHWQSSRFTNAMMSWMLMKVWCVKLHVTGTSCAGYFFYNSAIVQVKK
jgi:hypothetical protein